MKRDRTELLLTVLLIAITVATAVLTFWHL